MERDWIAHYEAVIGKLLAGLTPQNLALAVQVADLAQEVRGFGAIKQANMEQTRQKMDELMGEFRSQGPERLAAE